MKLSVPANLSMVTEIVAPSQRRMAFVLNRLAINIGMSIGPVIGGFLTTIDYHLLFYTNAVTSAAAGFYLVSVRFDTSGIKAEIQAEVPMVKKTIFHDRSFLFFLFGIVPVNLAFFQILGTLPLYIVNDLQYTTLVYGFLLSINTVLIIIAEVPLNNMMANISYRNSLITGALFTAVGFGAIAFARDTFPLIITIIIWTCGEMIFFPVSAAYASEAAPKNRRGEYMGYYQMTFNFAFSAGPWLGTVIYQIYGAFTVWIWTFIFGLISAGMMFFIKNIKVPVKEIQTLLSEDG
jgi:MFS family permease